MKLLIAILTAILFTSCSLFEQDYVRLQTNNQIISLINDIPSSVKVDDTIIVHNSDTIVNFTHYYKAVVISN